MSLSRVSPRRLQLWCDHVLSHYDLTGSTAAAPAASTCRASDASTSPVLVAAEFDTDRWRNGLAFCALIHFYQPSLIDFASLAPQNGEANCQLAFTTAEGHLAVLPLLTPRDFEPPSQPQPLLLLTYLAQLCRALKKRHGVGRQALDPLKGSSCAARGARGSGTIRPALSDDKSGSSVCGSVGRAAAAAATHPSTPVTTPTHTQALPSRAAGHQHQHQGQSPHDSGALATNTTSVAQPSDNAKNQATGSEPSDISKNQATGSEPSDNAENEATGSGPSDNAKNQATGSEPSDISKNQATSSEPSDNAENQATGSGPSDNAKNQATGSEPSDNAENQATDSESSDIAKNQATDSEPSDIAENQATGSEPSDNSKNQANGSEPSDNAKNHVTGSEPSDNAENQTSGLEPEKDRNAEPCEDMTVTKGGAEPTAGVCDQSRADTAQSAPERQEYARQSATGQPSLCQDTPAVSLRDTAPHTKSANRCYVCGEDVMYVSQRILINYQLMHRQCFKCVLCASLLSSANYCAENGRFRCEICPEKMEETHSVPSEDAGEAAAGHLCSPLPGVVLPAPPVGETVTSAASPCQQEADGDSGGRPSGHGCCDGAQSHSGQGAVQSPCSEGKLGQTTLVDQSVSEARGATDSVDATVSGSATAEAKGASQVVSSSTVDAPRVPPCASSDDPLPDNTPSHTATVEAVTPEPCPAAADTNGFNPFDEEEEEGGTGEHAGLVYPADLNPFGDEEDECEDGGRGQATPPPPQHYNPFDEDDDASQPDPYRHNNTTASRPALSSSARIGAKQTKPPRPPPPVVLHSPGASPRHVTSVQHSLRSGRSTGSLCSETPSVERKKRTAPKPPADTAEPSASGRVTPSGAGSDEHVRANPSTPEKPRRVKGPAPSLPVPAKRQVDMVPLKQLQQQLAEVTSRQLQLEQEGVQLEHSIRQLQQLHTPPTCAEGTPRHEYQTVLEDMTVRLFKLVAEQNSLMHRHSRLINMQLEVCLNRQHAELEHSIRHILGKAESLKSSEEKAREQVLINRLVSVVEERDRVASLLEKQSLTDEYMVDISDGCFSSDEDKQTMCSSPTPSKSSHKSRLKLFHRPSMKRLTLKLKHTKQQVTAKSESEKHATARAEDSAEADCVGVVSHSATQSASETSHLQRAKKKRSLRVKKLFDKKG